MPTFPIDQLQRLTIIGRENTGKSSLLLRYVEDTFSPEYIATVGVDFKVKTINVSEKRVKLQLWDTAGRLQFRSMIQSYFRGSMGYIFVFDISNRESLMELKSFIEDVATYRREHPSILVGNKCDLDSDRAVSIEEAQAIGASFDMPYIEASAKDNININEVFNKISYMVFHEITANLRGSWPEFHSDTTPEMCT